MIVHEQQLDFKLAVLVRAINEHTQIHFRCWVWVFSKTCTHYKRWTTKSQIMHIKFKQQQCCTWNLFWIKKAAASANCSKLRWVVTTINTDPHAQTHVYGCKISKEKKSSKFDQKNIFPQREASTSIVSIMLGNQWSTRGTRVANCIANPSLVKKTNLSKNFLVMHTRVYKEFNHCIKLMS